MLAEMDEEFGVGELVRESIKEEKNRVSLLCCYVSACAYDILCLCDIPGLHLKGPEWFQGRAQH